MTPIPCSWQSMLELSMIRGAVVDGVFRIKKPEGIDFVTDYGWFVNRGYSWPSSSFSYNEVSNCCGPNAQFDARRNNFL